MLRDLLFSLKEIILDYVKHRLFPITVVMIVLFSLLINRLFSLQIVEGEEHLENFIYKSQKNLTVPSVRGNIYDVNGKLLAYNELSYSVTFYNDTSISAMAINNDVSENYIKNQSLYETIKILESNGDSLSVDFPIIINSSGQYEYTVSGDLLKSFLRDVYSSSSFDKLDEEKQNSTAEDVVNYLCFGNEHDEFFGISQEYDKEMALKILSCRYTLWLNRFQQYLPVTIAVDISEISNAAITEHKDTLLGIDVTVDSLRYYNDAIYFSHIIGYVGNISSSEIEEYNNNDQIETKYTMNDVVGKSGIEKELENYLRGIDGEKKIYVDNLGKVIETTNITSPQTGNDVYLTIDANLTKYCYNALEKELTSIILANMTSSHYATTTEEDGESKENMDIPITNVYHGLFNNNIISLEEMTAPDATETEKQVYSSFTSFKSQQLSSIRNILLTEHTPVGSLSTDFQEYMEYICEYLNNNNVMDKSLIPSDDQVYLDYVNGLISLEAYLKHAISLEAIDISTIDASSNYYDTDEIYNILCEFILNKFETDTDFDKLVIQDMLQLSEISGDQVISLIYDQDILIAEGDKDLEEYKLGKFNAYEFMRRKIQRLEITPAMLALDPCSGSIVVIDVNTGEIRALVSYPSYDNNKLTNYIQSDYYNQLLNDKTTPLYQRATQQTTAPGSTYKMLTTIVGVEEGIINEESYIKDLGIFDKISTKPKCWIYPNGTHGTIGIEEAIQVSCNYFYYDIGYNLSMDEEGKYDDSLGLSRISKYATQFGLSENSGIELIESTPRISDNSAVHSAIGQGTNSYSATHLSKYVSTIANSGTCYNLTLIDKVSDYEGNVVYKKEPEVYSQITIGQTLWDRIHNGMRRVVTSNTSSESLLNKINVDVSVKTGTAQESEDRPNHALLVSYAPSNDPEVSVTIVIQNGYSSGNASELAGFIYAYMYDPDKLKDAVYSGNTQLSD